MMFDMAPADAPWFEHLTDSVDALAEAAREWRHASRAAELAHEQADLMRRAVHEGKVTGQPGPDASGWSARPFSRSPHFRALSEIERHRLDTKHHMRAEYEHSALLFASGAAWAIRHVRAGHQPARVVLPAGGTASRTLQQGELDVQTDAFEADRYSKASRLKAALEQLRSCLCSRGIAEEIAGQEYVSDHEASELFECWSEAENIADAAYDYGRLLREALGFVLIGPRADHARQLAESRAAETDGPAEVKP